MGCCSLEQNDIHLRVQAVAIEAEPGRAKKYHIRGYTYTSNKFVDRVCRAFQWMEICEKIAEVVDEFFHLLGSLFQRYTSSTVYQTLSELHHAAHLIEHVIHSMCFLGDAFRLTLEVYEKITGKEISQNKFFEYHENKQVDYANSLARISHSFNHFLSTAAFLSEIKLYHFGQLEKFFKFAPVFSGIGYAIGAINLIWRRHKESVQVRQIKKMSGQLQKKMNQLKEQPYSENLDFQKAQTQKQIEIAREQLEQAKKEQKYAFRLDLGIYLAGFVFAVNPLIKTISLLAPYAKHLNKVTAIAGIIHAICVVQRLMPRNSISGHFVLPDSQISEAVPHSHAHLKFVPV